MTAAALVFQLGALVYVDRRLHPISEERTARIAAAAPGSVAVVPPFPYRRSPWFVGDDLREARQRRNVAKRFGLAAVQLAGWKPDEPAPASPSGGVASPVHGDEE